MNYFHYFQIKYRVIGDPQNDYGMGVERGEYKDKKYI